MTIFWYLIFVTQAIIIWKGIRKLIFFFLIRIGEENFSDHWLSHSCRKKFKVLAVKAQYAIARKSSLKKSRIKVESNIGWNEISFSLPSSLFLVSIHKWKLNYEALKWFKENGKNCSWQIKLYHHSLAHFSSMHWRLKVHFVVFAVYYRLELVKLIFKSVIYCRKFLLTSAYSGPTKLCLYYPHRSVSRWLWH
jgi:hypothetical protein